MTNSQHQFLNHVASRYRGKKRKQSYKIQKKNNKNNLYLYVLLRADGVLVLQVLEGGGPYTVVETVGLPQRILGTCAGDRLDTTVA